MTPRTLSLSPDGEIPNNVLPVLIYRQVLPRGTRARAECFKAIFRLHGWKGIWRDTIYKFRHFHSNAHEVLGIARGQVVLALGGDHGRKLALRAGDAILLPAGTGHCRLSGSADLQVVGAYPAGQEHYDVRQKAASNVKRRRIVPLPDCDPLTGRALPAPWRKPKRR